MRLAEIILTYKVKKQQITYRIEDNIEKLKKYCRREFIKKSVTIGLPIGCLPILKNPNRAINENRTGCFTNKINKNIIIEMKK